MFTEFELFLSDFIPRMSKKERDVNKLLWIVETTGSKDASNLYAEFLTDYKLLFNDPQVYKMLLRFQEEGKIKDPKLLRQLTLLLLAFKANQIDKDLVKQMSNLEAQLSQAYLAFRPEYQGKRLTENEIRSFMATEEDPARRKEIWDKSKEIGEILAPLLLRLVKLRNQAAHELGYPNYFVMQLGLQEVDPEFLFSTFDSLEKHSRAAYQEMLEEVNEELSARFHVSKEELGPWSWAEPFCQEDPIAEDLDLLVEGRDLLEITKKFYSQMGQDTSTIVANSDFYEREGKNQHAFCIHIDREGDVRTLNNLKTNIKWTETILHEFGHAIYELGFNKNLPWLLKAPPHMLTTEAIALVVGRQPYTSDFLYEVLGISDLSLREKSEKSLKRRQLIFSRWALVMTYFEQELYKNPDQDLNELWWSLVERFQGIKRPPGREGRADFAAKYHISFCPVYYYSYLLGECLASQLEKEVAFVTKSRSLATPVAGELFSKLFKDGSLYPWDEHIKKVLGNPLSIDAWIHEFGRINSLSTPSQK